MNDDLVERLVDAHGNSLARLWAKIEDLRAENDQVRTALRVSERYILTRTKPKDPAMKYELNCALTVIQDALRGER